MKLKCPACAKLLQIPDAAAGKVVQCPCGKALRAPTPTAAGSGPRPAAGSPMRSASAGSAPNQPAASRPTTSGAVPVGRGGPAARGPVARGPAARGPAARGPVAKNPIDSGLFDELTEADSVPVYVPPKITPGSGTNPYANTAALEKFVSADELKAFSAAARDRTYVAAGIGRRIGGWFIDAIFTSVVCGGILFGTFLGFDAANIELGDDTSPLGPIFWIYVGSVMLPTMVHWIFISKTGQTMGKMLFGTVIVDESTGVPVGFAQGVGKRWIGFNFVTGIPIVGIFIALANPFYIFTERQRTLRDRFGETVVALKSSV